MGQVGRIALTLTGTVVGSYFGMPGLGTFVGSTLGGVLFPGEAPPAVEGPRMTDLSVTSSAYGTPISEHWGTMRLNGNIIWSEGIKEHKHTSKVKGAGGKGMSGPSQKQITYSYTCSLAIGLCQGVTKEVIRIWADSKLIYDVTGEEKIDIDVDDLDFKFYTGSETQMPDEHILAKQGDDAPAYRGLSYIVFENLDLTNFGNRVPNITCEVAKDVVANPSISYFDDADETEFPGPDNHFVTDAEHGWFISKKDVLVPPGRSIKCNNIRTGAILWENNIPVIDGVEKADIACIAPGGNVIVRTREQSTGGFQVHKIERWDAQTGIKYDVLDINASTPASGSHPIRWVSTVDGVSWDDTDGLPTTHCVAMNHTIAVISQKNGDFNLEDQIDVPNGYAIRDFQKIEDLSAYVLCWSQTSLSPATSPVANIKIMKLTGASGSGGASYVLDDIITFTPTNIDSSLTTTDKRDISGMIYDPTDETILMTFRQAIGEFDTFSDEITVKYDPRDGTILWKTTVRIFNSPGFFEDNITHPTSYESGAQYQQSGAAHGRFRMTDGQYTPYTVFEAGVGGNNVVYPLSYYNGDNNWGIGYAGGDGINAPDSDQGLAKVYYEGALRGSSTVSEVVKDSSLRSGLLLTDIDVSDLEDAVLPGYAVARQMSARDLITPLSQIFMFDAVEIDGKIKFLKRGRETVRTLTQDDLLRDGEDLKFSETRVQETDLPVSVSLTFVDATRDYQEQTYTSKRMTNPVPTMWSNNNVSVQIAASLTADFVKQQSEKLLYSAWEGRSNYEITMNWRNLDLDPTDVVTLTMTDGTVFRARFTTMDVGADMTIEAKMTSEDDAQYTSTATADPGNFPGQTVPTTGPTRLFVLDTVLLRDQDDGAGGVSRMYIAMGGYGQAGWTTGVCYSGTDQNSLELAGTVVDETTWGTVTNVIPDMDQEFGWGTDEVNFIDVLLATNLEDGLDNTTYNEMLAGANAAAIIRQDGEAEIIQFKTAVELEPGKWRLTSLLRGRRGSDAFSSGHIAGDTFVFLEPARMDRLEIPLAYLGVTVSYRGVQSGRQVDSGELIKDPASGNDLKPYAPVKVTAATVGSDITISWVRRTRVGGELRSGDYEVPLSETTEAYEVDVYDGVTFKRKLISTTPTVLYADADITTDFGTPPVSLRVVVYQMSSVVGRGFGRDVTVEVQP